jgi:hypothetical protein
VLAELLKAERVALGELERALDGIFVVRCALALGG